MNIFEKIKNYDALAAKVKDLEAQVEASKNISTELTTAKTALEEAVAANNTLTATNSDLVTKLAGKDTEIAALNEKAKVSTEKVEEVASHKAAEVLGAVGQPPVANGAAAAKVETDPFTEFANAKSPKEARAIFEAKINPMFAKKTAVKK